MNSIKIFLFIIVCFLSGCSAIPGMGIIDAINPLSGKGIDATAQVGKNNTSIKNKALANVDSETHSRTDNNIKAEKVEQITSYKDAPWLIIGFAIMAGFAIPNPFNYFSNRRHTKDQKEVIDGLRQQLTELYKESGNRIVEAGRTGAPREQS